MNLRFPLLTLVAILWLNLPLQAADSSEKPKFKLSTAEKAVLDLTNQFREKENLPPLKPGALLFEAARGHSSNMARQKKLAHELDGKNPNERVQATGYNPLRVGENVASGEKLSPAAALKLWINSPPHKKNLLSDKYQEIGIGIARDNQGSVYYTQVFGTSRDAKGAVAEATREEEKAIKEAVRQVLELTNKAREKEGVAALKMNEKLNEAARLHSVNMARQSKMAHILDGKKPSERVKETGYQYSEMGENVAFADELTVPLVFEGWMKSKGHREHILKDNFKEIGIGIARNTKGEYYFTQVFGTPRD